MQDIFMSKYLPEGPYTFHGIRRLERKLDNSVAMFWMPSPTAISYHTCSCHQGRIKLFGAPRQ